MSKIVDKNCIENIKTLYAKSKTYNECYFEDVKSIKFNKYTRFVNCWLVSRFYNGPLNDVEIIKAVKVLERGV